MDRSMAASSWVGVAVVLMMALVGGAEAYNFYTDVTITWGGADGHTKILQNGQMLTLSLDKISGGAFQSNAEFLFGRIDMQMKLVPGNSAGTVTTLYLSSLGPTHDEIDFEFLGNLTGEPYTIHTNVYAQGKGDKEMQFKPWFDPTSDFHTYSIVWNPLNIIFYVDNTPIRVFKNYENMGLPFPKVQPMRLYSSLWNADDWATQGGRVKTDWTQAPFTAIYRNYGQNACLWYGGASHCSDTSWMYQRLSPAEVGRMTYMQQTYMIYNYCTDNKRFPQGLPRECFLPQN